MDNTNAIGYHMHMFDGIRIYSSDPTWCQILGDMGATVTTTPDIAAVDFDAIDIKTPINITMLNAAIIAAMDNSDIIQRVFGRDVAMSRTHAQILRALYMSGGMTMGALRTALGYSADTATHAVDNAIYQMRKIYGHEIIINQNGIYKIGRV